MNATSPFEHWRRTRARVTREQFAAQHPYPFLISGSNLSAAQSAPRSGGPIEFDTQIQGPGTGQFPRPPGARPKRVPPLLILPLRKAPGSPFSDRLSVGRAPTCDLVIADPSVSKLHGHFREVTMASAVFTDAKSANGTRMDGVVVPPGGSIELKKFHHIVFGRVRLLMVSPSEVYDWLDGTRT